MPGAENPAEMFLSDRNRILQWTNEWHAGAHVEPGSMPPGFHLARSSYLLDENGTPETDTDPVWSFELRVPEGWISDSRVVTEIADMMTLSDIDMPVTHPGDVAAIMAAMLVMHEVAEYHGGMWEPHPGRSPWQEMARDLAQVVAKWRQRWPVEHRAGAAPER